MVAVVAENSEPDLFALDDIEEFLGAGTELGFVVVDGPRFALYGEEALHYNGVNGKKH